MIGKEARQENAKELGAKTSWEALSENLVSRRGRIVLWILLFQALLWLYYPSFSGPFVYDGIPSIANNVELRQPEKWWQMLGKHSNSLQFDRRPVPGLLTLLNFQISGLKVFTYRLLNLGIHWLTAILIGETILLLGKRLWSYQEEVRIFAASVAVVWAVHPLNATPVVYIYQRMESLAVLFFVFSLYAMLRIQRENSSNTRWKLLLLLSAAFSMLSKEIGVVLLFVLPIVDRISNYDNWKQFLQERLRLYSILAVLTAGLLVYLLTGARVREVAAEGPLGSPVEYAKVQFRILLRYLKLVFWPEPLVFVAAPRHVILIKQWLPQALFLCLILGAIVSVARRKRYRWVWVALVVAGAVLAPTSSLLPIPNEPEADYRMYLPSACVIALGLAGLIYAGNKLRASGGFILAIIFGTIIGLGMQTRSRAVVFRSELSIWEDVVRKEPENAQAWANFGYALVRQDLLEEASFCAERLLEGGGATGSRDVMAWGTHLKGVVLLRQKKFEQAIEQFDEALQLLPAAENFRVDLARCLLELGRNQEATQALNQEVKLNPSSLEARRLLEDAGRREAP